MKQLAVSAILLVAAGCTPAGEATAPRAEPGRKLRVAAVNYPLAFFAERIGGDHVEVVFPVPPGQDPASWTPAAEAVAEYQSADIVLLNGATYAQWVPKVTLQANRLVDTSAAVADRYIRIAEAVTHSHGPGGEHAHAGTASTTWLDLTIAIRQAQAVRDALTARRLETAEAFEANMTGLIADLWALDGQLLEVSVRQPGLPLIGSHPVYQYLARRYGLNLKTVTWEPDAPPNGQQWHDLEHILSDHPAEWMIWEQAPHPDTVARLRSAGIEVVVFNPCANRPDQGDFLSVMRANTARLAAAFE